MNPSSSVTRFNKADRGIASLEFALIAPMFLIMLMGVFDASRAMIIYQQVCDAAHNVANAASVAVTVNPDNSTTMNDDEANTSMSIIWAEMPWLHSGILKGSKSVSVILTSIAFRPIAGCDPAKPPAGSNCYNANVAFSIPYGGAPDQTSPPTTIWDSATRSCGPLTQYSGTPPSGLSYLSVLSTGGVSGPDALLIADVHYKFQPTVPFSFLTGAIDFWVTALGPPRSGSTTGSSSGAGQYTTYTGSRGTGSCSNV